MRAGLPSYGPRVVAIGTDPEAWRHLARSSHRVRATFQAGEAHAKLAQGSLRAPLVPALTALAIYGRSWAWELPGVAGRLFTRARGAAGGDAHPIFEVALGYHSAVDLQVKPIAERPIALSFAGSVKRWEGRWGRFAAKMGAPKVRSRREVLRAVDRLQRANPDLRVEVRITGSFSRSSPVTGPMMRRAGRTGTSS